MNIIIDNMFVHRVLSDDSDPEFKYVHEKLLAGELRFVYGGKLKVEYLRSSTLQRILRVFDQKGVAQAYDDNEIKIEATKIRKGCRSNDSNIIALARISGARLLCSDDQELHRDFKDAELLDNPRGKVYQTSSHKLMLDSYCRLCRRRCG